MKFRANPDKKSHAIDDHANKAQDVTHASIVEGKGLTDV
jgi:hypothetical protein